MAYTDQCLLFNTIFNPGLKFKYRKASYDKIDGSQLPNTGGEWVFVRPELSVHLIPNIAVSSRLELPIYSYVDGTQLTPTLRFTTGISYTLKKAALNILN